MPLGANKAAIMGVAGVSTASVVLLSDQDADSDASIVFTSGITSTYGEYIFRFYNCNPATNLAEFTFQVNASDATGYNELITSTIFEAFHDEADSTTGLSQNTSYDQPQGTAFQTINVNVGNGGDESCAGELHLFNPASTTYVKHFYTRSVKYGGNDYAADVFTAGYFNTTTAIDDIQFKFSAGDFDGKIKMWGVK